MPRNKLRTKNGHDKVPKAYFQKRIPLAGESFGKHHGIPQELHCWICNRAVVMIAAPVHLRGGVQLTVKSAISLGDRRTRLGRAKGAA